MNNLFPQPWNIPIFDYWLFYLVLGIIGFALCLYSRFFFYGFVPLLLWFCIADMHSFYYQDVGSNKLGPDAEYIFQVAISMIISLSLAGSGTYLNWRRERFKFSCRRT